MDKYFKQPFRIKLSNTDSLIVPTSRGEDSPLLKKICGELPRMQQLFIHYSISEHKTKTRKING
jgi:hypothetical protein